MNKKTNVIMITTDQQRKDSLGSYGSSFVDTPNLDSMANNGVSFDRAYCTSPVCTPSRATLYSGRYASDHGAYNVGTKVSEDMVMLPEIFKTNGYRTHHIGKLHFQPYHASPDTSLESRMEGWEKNFDPFPLPYYHFDGVDLAQGHSMFGIKGHYGLWVKAKSGKTDFSVERQSENKFSAEGYSQDIPSELHNSRWTADRTVNFLKEASQSDQPFFLSVGFQDPHHPHVLPAEKAKKLKPELIPPPRFQEGELDDKPSFFKDVHSGQWNGKHVMHGQYPMAGQDNFAPDYRNVSSEDARVARAYYYGMVELIDEAMGSILSTLDEVGLAENTIIIFTTDHGELLGDHGIWLKGPFHYEELINIPLIIQWKGHTPKINHRVDSVVSLVDLAPTLVELCQLQGAPPMHGLDITPLIKGEKIKIRDYALVECVDDPHKIRLKTIVTERYKLTFYYGDFGKEIGELYDLQNDPSELHNLWNDPSLQSIKINLISMLLNELECLEAREKRHSYA